MLKEKDLTLRLENNKGKEGETDEWMSFYVTDKILIEWSESNKTIAIKQ